MISDLETLWHQAKLLFDPVRGCLFPPPPFSPTCLRKHTERIRTKRGAKSYKPALPTHLRCLPPTPPRVWAAVSAVGRTPTWCLPDCDSHLEPEALRRLIHAFQGRLLFLSRPGPRTPRSSATRPTQGHGRCHEAAGQSNPGGARERSPQFVHHHDLQTPIATKSDRAISTRGSRSKTRLGWAEDQRPPAQEGREECSSAAGPQGSASLPGSGPEASGARPSKSSPMAGLVWPPASSRIGPGGAGGEGGAPASGGWPRKH